MVEQKAQRVLSYFQSLEKGNTFGGQIILNVTLGKARMVNNQVELELALNVNPQFCSPMGTMHGGALCTLVDYITSIPIVTADRLNRKLTSVQLQCSFSTAAYSGQMLLLKTSCGKVGKNLAFSTVEIWSGNKLVATGKQTAFMLPDVIDLHGI